MVFASWPQYDESKLVESRFEIVVSINGKVRDKMMIDVNWGKEEILSIAKQLEKIAAQTKGKTIIKEIYVPKKLVNLVVK